MTLARHWAPDCVSTRHTTHSQKLVCPFLQHEVAKWCHIKHVQSQCVWTVLINKELDVLHPIRKTDNARTTKDAILTIYQIQWGRGKGRSGCYVWYTRNACSKHNAVYYTQCFNHRSLVICMNSRIRGNYHLWVSHASIKSGWFPDGPVSSPTTLSCILTTHFKTKAPTRESCHENHHRAAGYAVRILPHCKHGK